MRVLMDTHAFLWAGLDETKLSDLARSLFVDTAHQPLLSVASLWEVAINVSKGRLKLERNFDEFATEVVADAGIAILPLEMAHLALVATLPHYHRDPFDRLLVAQALAEGISLLSADAELDAYGVQRLW